MNIPVSEIAILILVVIAITVSAAVLCREERPQ